MCVYYVGVMCEQKLHANKLNKNACKSLIAAEYVGFKLETTPGFELTDTISPEYLKMNPMGKALNSGTKKKKKFLCFMFLCFYVLCFLFYFIFFLFVKYIFF